MKDIVSLTQVRLDQNLTKSVRCFYTICFKLSLIDVAQIYSGKAVYYTVLEIYQLNLAV